MAIKTIILLCVLAIYIPAKPNKTADSKQNCACPEKPVVFQIEHQEISADAKDKAQASSPPWYTAFKRPDGWLFIATVLTFLAIAYQSRESAKATKAMRDSVDVQIATQRAELIIRFDNPIPGINYGHLPQIKVKVVNRGPSSAHHLTYQTWIDISSDPFVDFGPSAEYVQSSNPITVYPNSPDPTIVTIGFRQLSTGEDAMLQAGKTLLCFRIRFDYKDAFGKSRWQNFGFATRSVGMEYLPKYNDSN